MKSGFKNFEYCFPIDDVDIENDEFKLHIDGDDGVSDLMFVMLVSNVCNIC